MFARSYLTIRQINQFRYMCKLADPLRKINKDHIKFFMKALDITKLQTYNIFMKNPNLHDFDLGRLTQTCNVLSQFGFEKTTLKQDPNVLTLPAGSVEQHILILQECGFTEVTTTCLRSYITMTRKRISLLKAHQFISENTDVPNNLLSHLDSSFKMPSSIELNDDLTLNRVRFLILREYLKWYLEVNDTEVDQLFKTYKRIPNRSFHGIKSSLKQLDEMGFTKDKIKRNGFLIYSHSENTEKMLNEVREIAGLDIRLAIKKCPKLLMTNYVTIIKTLQYLKDFNIPDKSIQRCLEIFTLSSETVHERLSDLKDVPEFKALCSHPRILRLIHYQRKALSRLQYLQLIKVKCASLHILASSRTEFERYAKEGSDRTKGKDIVLYLINELDITGALVREHLSRHIYWCHVPVTSVEATLDMLRKRSYLNKHLVSNLHILLYPKAHVQSTLDELSSQRKHPDLPHIDDLTNLERSKIISLCMYLLEKRHHFSGNGIWDDHSQELAVSVDVNAPLPPETIGKKISYKYKLAPR